MKKLLSILMVATMLMSVLALGVSAEQTNMEVTVPKFSAQPTFDGVVSVEEWGEKTLRVVTEGAAIFGGEEIGVNEALGLKNIYYYYEFEGICDTLAYDMWLRWDDTYMYIAMVVDDPDPFSNPNNGGDCWAGDCVQLRIDDKGPSAKMFKENPNFDYKVDAFNGVLYKTPWSSDNEVIDAILALAKGKTPTLWKASSAGGDDMVSEFGGMIGVNTVDNGDDTCTTTYEAAIPWAAVNALLVPKAGDVYGMAVVAACSDSNAINAALQWGQGAMFKDGDKVQPKGTRGGSQAIILSDESVTPAEGYDIYTEPAETTVVETESKVTLATMGEGETNAPVGKPQETTTKPPVGSSVVVDDGLPVGAIIGIVAGVLAVVVVVAIIIVKKNKTVTGESDK